MNRRNLLRAFAAAAAVRQAPAAPSPVVQPGWDWSLPPGTRPAPYSGFVTWGRKRFSEVITVCGIRANWAALCPAPGQYDWKPLLQQMRDAREQGMRIGLHVQGVESDKVPDWVVKRYGVPVVDVIPLQENQPWRLKIVPPWHPDVQREYAAFMEAFGKTGIPQQEDVVYGYIHGISPSRGEELFLRPADIDDWEKRAGLTPDGLAGALRSRLDAMLRAFRGVEGKLAWMGGGPLGAGQKGHEEYARKTDGLLEYALEKGTGWRGGGVDFQHFLFNSKALGASVSPEGYCLIDESLPIHDGKRFVGDENEEYGKYWEWRFGPAEKYDYRHRISTLRTLQVRENFQMVSEATLQLNPELNRYALLTQGRHAHDSPDAWAYLRECAIMAGGRPQTVKNLERWLVQRDVEGHGTVPCERVDRFRLGTDPPDRNYDFDGRRTDRKNGQRGIAFQLDRRFWSAPRPAQVKVTFTDREKTRWRLEWTGAAGRTETGAPVENTGGGERKTATFSVASLAAPRALPGGMDFRLVIEGPGDLAVTMVRVIKV